MGLRREVDHRVDLVPGQNARDQLAVADVAVDKGVGVPGLGAGFCFQRAQVAQVARVGQLVQVHKPPVRVARAHGVEEVGADESAAAGDEQAHGGLLVLGVQGFVPARRRIRKVVAQA